MNGGYSYTYNVSLTSQLDATGSGVSPQFGTLYDFGPILTNAGGTFYTATGLLASSFSFAFNATDTPAAFETTPMDSALTNARFTYTGDTNYMDSGYHDDAHDVHRASRQSIEPGYLHPDLAVRSGDEVRIF